MEDLNERLAELVDYRNGFEKHRELGRSAQQAWDEALAEGGNKSEHGVRPKLVFTTNPRLLKSRR